jgi:hypothetical protein
MDPSAEEPAPTKRLEFENVKVIRRRNSSPDSGEVSSRPSSVDLGEDQEASSQGSLSGNEQDQSEQGSSEEDTFVREEKEITPTKVTPAELSAKRAKAVERRARLKALPSSSSKQQDEEWTPGPTTTSKSRSRKRSSKSKSSSKHSTPVTPANGRINRFFFTSPEPTQRQQEPASASSSAATQRDASPGPATRSNKDRSRSPPIRAVPLDSTEELQR